MISVRSEVQVLLDPPILWGPTCFGPPNLRACRSVGLARAGSARVGGDLRHCALGDRGIIWPERAAWAAFSRPMRTTHDIVKREHRGRLAFPAYGGGWRRPEPCKGGGEARGRSRSKSSTLTAASDPSHGAGAERMYDFRTEGRGRSDVASS